MRRTHPFLLSILVLAAPLPAAAQVTVDPNALNRLGSPSLPAVPPAKAESPVPSRHHAGHKRRHPGKAKVPVAATGHAAAEDKGTTAEKTLPTGKPAIILPPAGVKTESRGNLGSSFATVPVLPGAVPPLPVPPKITVDTPAPKKPKPAKSAQPGAALPAVLPPATLPPVAPPPSDLSPAAPGSTAPQPAAPPATVLAAPKPAAPPSAPPPAAAPEPVAAARPPVAPAPPAPAPVTAPAASQNSLPPGADLLTLPYSNQDTDASGAIPALIRDFVTRHGTTTLYIVRAYASQPKGDDDPSSPRRVALMRAQGVQAALTAAGVDPIHIRLLALGNSAGSAGKSPAERVDLIAMPPAPGHSTTSSSP